MQQPKFELTLPTSTRLGDQLGTQLPRDSHSFESIPFRTPRPHNDLPQFDFVTEYLNELNKFRSLLDCKDPKEHIVSLGRSILVGICEFVNDRPQLMKAIDLQNLCLLLSQCSDFLENPAAVDLKETEELAKKLSKKSTLWKWIGISFLLFSVIAITAMAITGFMTFAGTTTLSLLLLGLISSKIFGLTTTSLALIGTFSLAGSFVPGILGCYILFKEPRCQPLINSVSELRTHREEQKSSLKNTENDSENSQAPTPTPSLS